MEKGIYSLEIEGRLYVGKDSRLSKCKRKREHQSLLNKGVHWNRELQDAFDRQGYFNYNVLYSSEELTLKELEALEVHYISETKSYLNGFNQTTGGLGGNGYKYTEEQLLGKSERVVGEKNPLSKLTNAQFYEIVELFKEGKTNKYIAEIYGLHDRYVSLIRHKKRFNKLWENVDFDSSKSNGQVRGLTYVQFLEVIHMIERGSNNVDAGLKFNLNPSTISMLRRKKTYKRYWDEYESNK